MAPTPASPPLAGTRRGALAGLLRDAARLDRTQSDPVVSARNAIGLVLPLVIGALAGNAALGLASTIGALQTAFADRPGAYRLRMLRMLGTALAAGVTSGLAVLFSHSDLGSAALLAMLGFLAGLLLAGGPSSAQVGVAGTGAALVIGHTPDPPSVALHVALLVLAGGVGQTVLAIAAWPLGRHRPERLALAALYRDLGSVCERPSGTDVGPPAGDAVGAARVTLYGLGHDHGPSVEAYRVLLDEADRIRREVVVLSGYVERLLAAGEPGAAGAIRTALTDAGQVLVAVAAALEQGGPVTPDILAPARAGIREQLAVLEASGELTGRAAAARLRGLSGQLRAAVETSRTGATEGRSGEEPDRRGVRRLRDPVAILRANLTSGSTILRHAIRLGVLVGASDLVVRLTGVDRGYWVPLTVLVVLRPDFASTFQRSSMRTFGTVLGLLIASELVHWVPGGQWYQVALLALFFFGMRLAGPGNLALSAVGLAGVVVVLLSLAGVPPHATLLPRAVDTLAGGVLALLAVLASPQWERSVLPDQLGVLLEAYRTYLAALLDPGVGVTQLQRDRAACRLARSNARASVDRARAEPVRGQREVERGETVLVHSHRFVHALMTMDAVRPSLPDAAVLPEFAEFAAAAEQTLTGCARAVREGAAPRETVRLRPLQEALVTVLRSDATRVPDQATAAAVVDATDRITNSLDTLTAELRRQAT